ncbi:MAG: hypothetical protein K8T10_22090, partial [Candidatus Eremiobacteraeota bacterium]|nr:hypothetical protein [Candidatus Eremiobacteraeota bacterium]
MQGIFLVCEMIEQSYTLSYFSKIISCYRAAGRHPHHYNNAGNCGVSPQIKKENTYYTPRNLVCHHFTERRYHTSQGRRIALKTIESP